MRLVNSSRPEQIFKAAVAALEDRTSTDLRRFEPLRCATDDKSTRRKRAVDTAAEALAAIWRVSAHGISR
jgi:hypothetical protein